MLRLVGFFLALFMGSLRGDVGAESGCVSSSTFIVAGLRIVGRFMSRVSFFTFLVASCIVWESSTFAAGCLSSLRVFPDALPLTIMAVKGVEGAIEVADSGEDEEVSETSGESNVEFVVVGEDSVDSDCVNKDVILPR